MADLLPTDSGQDRCDEFRHQRLCQSARWHVRLGPADFDLGSTGRNEPAKVQLLLRSAEEPKLEAVTVSLLVNRPRNDGPELLERTNPNPGSQ